MVMSNPHGASRRYGFGNAHTVLSRPDIGSIYLLGELAPAGSGTQDDFNLDRKS